MTTLLSLALALNFSALDWNPVSFGPKTAAVIGTRLAVSCLGRIPPVAYQLTDSGVAVRVGGRSVRAGCTRAAVNAAMQYRNELPGGTAVRQEAAGHLQGVVLSHATPEGIAELHRLTAETVAKARE
jgi:hypothetical protein